MNGSSVWTLAAGLSLVVVVNVVALAGAAFNRAGEPESALRFSERELRPPYTWGWETENSGLSLGLLWRVPPAQLDERHYGTPSRWSAAAWLDAAKLREFGIEVPGPSATESEKRRYDKLGEKEVFLVLELNGPAFQSMLEAAEARARRAAEAARDSSVAELWERERSADRSLQEERDENSRLFAIDAGMDRAPLRSKYADRTRYAIVRGRIHPPRLGPDQPRFGYVDALAIDEVNVPVGHRAVFVGVAEAVSRGGRYTGPGFEVEVAFGQRLEPWLVSARRTSPAEK